MAWVRSSQAIFVWQLGDNFDYSLPFSTTPSYNNLNPSGQEFYVLWGLSGVTM